MQEITHHIEVAGGGTIHATANPTDPWSAAVADRVVVTPAVILARFDEDFIIQAYFTHEGEYTLFDFETSVEVFRSEWYRFCREAAAA